MRSKHQARAHWFAPGLLCFLSLWLADPAWSHPELMLQIERLDGEIATQPANAELLLRRGDLYRRDGNYQAAWQDFTAARKLDPNLSENHFYAGRLALEMGDVEVALTQLNQYLQQNPGHAAAWVLLGDAQMALGKPLAAAGDYAEAIKTSAHQSPTLYLQLAQAWNTAGREYQPKALQVIDQGVEHFPLEVSLLGLGTDIALALGELGQAQGYMEPLPEPILALPQWQARLARLAQAQPSKQ